MPTDDAAAADTCEIIENVWRQGEVGCDAPVRLHGKGGLLQGCVLVHSKGARPADDDAAARDEDRHEDKAGVETREVCLDGGRRGARRHPGACGGGERGRETEKGVGGWGALGITRSRVKGLDEFYLFRVRFAASASAECVCVWWGGTGMLQVMERLLLLLPELLRAQHAVALDADCDAKEPQEQQVQSEAGAGDHAACWLLQHGARRLASTSLCHTALASCYAAQGCRSGIARERCRAGILLAPAPHTLIRRVASGAQS